MSKHTSVSTQKKNAKRSFGASPQPSNPSRIPQVYEDPYGRPWEDLLVDEKIDRLMRTVTTLYRENNRLIRQAQEFERHKHREDGPPYIEKRLGEETYREDSYLDNFNPFNAREFDNRPERG